MHLERRHGRWETRLASGAPPHGRDFFSGHTRATELASGCTESNQIRLPAGAQGAPTTCIYCNFEYMLDEPNLMYLQI
jgi:hypothetical protein